MKLPIAIRKQKPSDLEFIYSSWLKSFRKSPYAENIRTNIYFTNHHKLLEPILGRSTIFIACNPEEKDQIYGYAVGEYRDEDLILHWIYVKHPYRGMGIGSELMNQFGGYKKTYYTHHVDNQFTKSMIRKGVNYNPYLTGEAI